MDVGSVFLNEILQEEAYVEQPKGFINPKYPNHIFRLKKALYVSRLHEELCDEIRSIQLFSQRTIIWM